VPAWYVEFEGHARKLCGAKRTSDCRLASCDGQTAEVFDVAADLARQVTYQVLARKGLLEVKATSAAWTRESALHIQVLRADKSCLLARRQRHHARKAMRNCKVRADPALLTSCGPGAWRSRVTTRTRRAEELSPNDLQPHMSTRRKAERTAGTWWCSAQARRLAGVLTEASSGV